MSIEERVKEILLDILDIDEKNVVPDATFITDLGASSVDLVEIIAAVENHFDIEISDEEAEQIRTVQALIDFLKTKTS
jgi:acyl carrier protein